MRPVVTSLRGKLAEVYFGFKEIEEVIYIYEETREKSDERFHSVYAEAVSLAEKFGSEEKRPRLCGRQKIEKTSLQKQLRNTDKDRYTYRF